MADETRDERTLVKEKQEEMQPIFGRMDADEDLYFLKPYVMMDLKGEKAIEEVANITLPDPLLFTTKSIAIIGGATMQTVVKGNKMKDPETTKIEQFLKDIYYMIDEWLVKRGIPGLDGFINEQICIRGRIGARCGIRIDKEKELIPDVLPLDTRYFLPETDNKGMVWGAAEFRRSKTQIKREYNIDIGEDIADVVDFWDFARNVVLIGEKEEVPRPNRYGYPPFVYSICPAGSMFGTEKAIAHRGESILWANRNLWPEMNRVTTILQTLNISTLFGGLQLKSKDGKAAKPKESPFGPRKILQAEIGGGYEPMPINDIKVATQLLYSVLEGRLQRGSLSAVDYGTLTFPLSAIAITRLTGSRDDIFLPRVQAKALFYQALSRMIIKQCIAIGKTLHLGPPGSQNTYTASDLKGDYTITYRFYTETKEQALANLSIANAAQGFLSPDTIRREVLNLQDPDGEKVKWESAQAKRVDEVLFLFDAAYNLVDKEKPTDKERMEAEILMDRVETIMTQRRMTGKLGELEGQRTPEPEAQPQGKGLLPLLGGGGQSRETPQGETEEVKRE